MKRNWIEACMKIAAGAWVAVGVLLITAPVIAQAPDQAPVIAQAPDQDGFETWFTMVDGEPIDDVLRNPDRAPQIVQALLGNSDREFVKELLASLRQGVPFPEDVRGVPSALGGIAGFAVVSFLEAYAAGSPVGPTISGKIKDYVYDEDDLSGHLAVDTRVYLPWSRITNRFHWDIEVRPGTYQVIPHSGDPNNPFPNTVTFDPAKLPEIAKRGLDHKLFAQGPGIRVRHVYKIRNDGSIQRYPNNHVFYASTVDSCIDLMFAGEPPAIYLPPQRGYCLGRCAQPAVVNSH
jgi:hypothetical protein